MSKKVKEVSENKEVLDKKLNDVPETSTDVKEDAKADAVDTTEAASIGDDKIKEVLDRINELSKTRSLLETKKKEIETHEKDLNAIATIKGKDSDDWKVKNEILKSSKSELDELDAKIGKLSFNKSELKPILDAVTKKFETKIREEQEHEYHIELGTKDKDGKNNGKKIYKDLLDYIHNNVAWSAKDAAGLYMLDVNMAENKAWVQSKDFDGVIMLRSANVLVLYTSILEKMQGTGSFAARKFLAVWANCGKAITDAVRDIQKSHDDTRKLGANLNTIEEEFNVSVDDLPHTEALTTKEEVAPDVDMD